MILAASVCCWGPEHCPVTECPSCAPTPTPDSVDHSLEHHLDPFPCGDPLPICLTCLGKNIHHSSEGDDVKSEGAVHLEGVIAKEGALVCCPCENVLQTTGYTYDHQAPAYRNVRTLQAKTLMILHFCPSCVRSIQVVSHNVGANNRPITLPSITLYCPPHLPVDLGTSG